MIITFEPLNESHFPLLLKWLEAPHVKAWWDLDVKWTPALIEAKYTDYVHGYKLENGIAKTIKAYVTCVDSMHIGYVQIYNAYDFARGEPLIGLPLSLAAFDVFIGETAYLKRGIGSLAIAQFLKERALAYTHVFADPKESNFAAIRTYEKAGFKQLSTRTNAIWMLKRIKEVRLADYDIKAIEDLFRNHFAHEDKLWLFGSRIDLSKKGGDIDLYVETNAKTIDDAINMRSNFIWNLEQKIGEQKIDVVLNMLNFPHPLPIHHIARTEGVRMI